MKKKLLVLCFFLLITCNSKIAIATEHVHSDVCYNGEKHVHTGSPSTRGGCYQGAYTSGGTYTCGTSGGTTRTETGTRSTCEFCGGSHNRFYVYSKCTGCGSSFLSWMQQDGCGCPNYPSYTNTYNHTATRPGSYALNCGKTEGKYYNSSGVEVSPTCYEVVVGISAKNQTVTVGDDIVKTATATYLDGHIATVNCTVSGFNSNQVGTQTVTLTYTGKVGTAKSSTTAKITTTIKVTVQSGLEYLTVVPSSSVVYNGTEPTYTVKAHYGNSTSKTLTVSQYTKTGWNSGVGTKTVTFSYTENSKTVKKSISITVKPNVTRLEVTPSVYTVYNGSKPAFTVKVIYENNTNITLISSQYNEVGWSNGAGIKTVNFSYTENNKTVAKSVTIHVKPNVVSLYVTPSATTIYQGESVSFTVKAYYEDSTSRELTKSEYGQSSFDANATGVQSISFYYIENNRTVTANVNITVLPELSSISVEANKLEIYRGDEAPVFTLTAHYESGLSKMISQGKYEAFNNNRIGSQTIPFSYTENDITKTTSITIMVKPNLSHITTYVVDDIIFLGQELDLTVTAFYEDNTDRILSLDDYNIIGFDNRIIGDQNVSISYTENNITASEVMQIIILESGFDAYASAPIITPTSNSIGSEVLFTAKTHNAEVVDILYSVDSSGYFSSKKSNLKLMEGAHTIKAKTIWRRLLDTNKQMTGYTVYKYDLSVPGVVINKPTIDFDIYTNTVTITDNGAINTVIDKLEYSIGILEDGEYTYTEHIYNEPFILSSLGHYIIKARVVDVDANRSDEAELNISIEVKVDTPVINYNNTSKSFSLQNFGCINANLKDSYYKINDGEWKLYSHGENIALTDGEYVIKAYNKALRDGTYYNSSEASKNVTVASVTPTPIPGSSGNSGDILRNSTFLSLFALMVFLFGWMIKQKLN